MGRKREKERERRRRGAKDKKERSAVLFQPAANSSRGVVYISACYALYIYQTKPPPAFTCVKQRCGRQFCSRGCWTERARMAGQRGQLLACILYQDPLPASHEWPDPICLRVNVYKTYFNARRLKRRTSSHPWRSR